MLASCLITLALAAVPAEPPPASFPLVAPIDLKFFQHSRHFGLLPFEEDAPRAAYDPWAERIEIELKYTGTVMEITRAVPDVASRKIVLAIKDRRSIVGLGLVVDGQEFDLMPRDRANPYARVTREGDFLIVELLPKGLALLRPGVQFWWHKRVE